MADQENRPHRKAKEKKQRDSGAKNPKAFTFAKPGRLQKQQARSQDVKEKRLHVPLIDRAPEEAPPLVVAVVGPPQVGKTTLIKSLIRRYSKQTISNPTGPITIVTSKRRRLTFMECPADSIAAMMDIAKIADIVLLMIDGKYGFEMETMEFLNILASIGMPGNIFGILTHLDLFKKQDTLRTQKSRLKHRFWSELYHGAKLFYLSGVVNGRYPDREINNISRFIAVMKNPRPLIWRNTHPYCLADRFLDITPPTDIEDNSKCDRTVALYGYLRGTNFPAEGAKVHVPGLGDLDVLEIEALADPCPTPFMDQAIQKATGKGLRRRLGEKQKVLFAPMSDVGGVLVEKDAVYVDVKTSTFDRHVAIGDRGLGEQLMVGLQGERRILGEGNGDVRLFEQSSTVNKSNGTLETRLETRNRRPARKISFESLDAQIVSSNEDEEYGTGEEEAGSGDVVVNGVDEERFHQYPNVNFGKQVDSEDFTDDIVFADSDSDIGTLSSNEDDYESYHETSSEAADEDGGINWKDDLAAKAAHLYKNKTLKRTADLTRLMYNDSMSLAEAVRQWKGSQEAAKDDEKSQDDDDFLKRRKPDTDTEDAEDRAIPVYDYGNLESKFSATDVLQALREKFSSVRTNKMYKSHDDNGGSNIFEDSENSAGSEGDGEFEDLETKGGDSSERGDDLQSEREKNARRKEELKLRFEEEDREGFANDRTMRQDDPGPRQGEFGEDEWYDAQKAKMQTQLAINRAEFDTMDEYSRIKVEGYRAGIYARFVVKVSYEFSKLFDARHPIIIGGLTPTEQRFGFVQVRIKRHRWHKKILKTNDPLIFSLGWRRFQTLPIYSIHENRMRYRMLKYTPEHMHCVGTFYGPLIAPNTGFCCIQSLSSNSTGFRLAATGTVLNVDESVEIVKKLKLKGYPHKIYKNTAIIKDMLSSELEIMKFKSGNLRTVSGIRGMIKGRAGKQYPPGYIRAGFEDKILMSDIVFLSTWRQVKPKELYIPVTNLLMPSRQQANKEGSGWSGMRLTGEVRSEQGLATPSDKNSVYRHIERPDRYFNPLRVPRKLAADLPFKSQIAKTAPQKTETYLQKRAVVVGGEERRARELMQKLSSLRNEKVALRRIAQEKRREPYRQKITDNLEKKSEREKREKDEYWRREGKKRKNQITEGSIIKKSKR